MAQTLETVILNNLINDETFARISLPHLKKEYFADEHRTVFELILGFVSTYNRLPTSEILEVEFGKTITDSSNSTAIAALEVIKGFDDDLNTDQEWLITETEKWCKDKAVMLAVMKSIEIIDGKEKKLKEGMIPDILQEALSVTFDTSVGHDYFKDAEDRIAFYKKVEAKIPFDLEMLNTITNGGVTRKTLNVVMASTGSGKSLFMCHLAAAAMTQGQNVLYITMEMSEYKIAERIDANLLDINIQDLKKTENSSFISKVSAIKSKTSGQLVVKEYPTASAHAGHFRALLTELKMKKDFKPDLIFIDYLNICSSSRLSGSTAGTNSYGYVKAIAEELRGLAVEFDVPIWSATQTNRDGFGNTDVDLTNTSESIGLSSTVDLQIALVVTDELRDLNQIMVKQLKNRYNDLEPSRFVLGIERPKMRLYDVQAATQGLVGGTSSMGTPPVAQTPFDQSGTPRNKSNFAGFTV